jgi:hypothetical protein
MKYIYIAIFVLGAFVAIWIFFVVPAERRHHERKIELVRKKIERHAEQSTAVDGAASDSKDGDSG